MNGEVQPTATRQGQPLTPPVMSSTLHVLLADDHDIVRAGLRSVLESMSAVRVVGEASNGREAVELAAEKEPDLVVMDLSMPDLNGFEATRRILEEHPDSRVLVLSVHRGEEYVREALRAGATGYLLKESSRDELERALRALNRGQRYLSPAVSDAATDRGRPASAGSDASAGPLGRLTPRQREVLQLVAEGYTSREIAEKLGLSAKTVETHRRNIKDRLDIDDLAGLVRFAVRAGLVSPEW